MKKFLIPLVIFLVLVGFLAVGLGLNPREVPSPLINNPAPAFSLPVLDAPEQKLSAQDMRGKVWILNVWASWCVACRVEHPLLVAALQLASAGRICEQDGSACLDGQAMFTPLRLQFTAQ